MVAMGKRGVKSWKAKKEDAYGLNIHVGKFFDKLFHNPHMVIYPSQEYGLVSVYNTASP